MDFEKLGDAIVNDTIDDSDIYAKVQSGEQLSTIGKSDLENAKGFLSVINKKLNISLYDHLADVLKKILRSQIPDAVANIEELSLQVKQLRQKGDSDFTEVEEIGEGLQNFLKEKQIFYKFIQPATDDAQAVKIEDKVDEDEEEEEEEEATPEVESKESAVDKAPDLADILPDIHFIMNRFLQAGIGLGLDEIWELNLALKDLATEFKLRKVRFWGKIFGIQNDYYIAEAPYQDNVVQEDFGYQTAKEPEIVEMKEEGEEEEEDQIEEKDKEDVEINENDEEEKEDDGEEKEPEEVKIPPVPEPQPKTRKRVPAEDNGTGVNEYLYFVCKRIGHPWRVLPFMTPQHIVEARYIKRFFTGDLETQIRGCAPFPGKEAHYLRAQVARITASTYVAPKGSYKIEGEKDEDDDENEGEEEEEEEGDTGVAKGVVINAKYEPRPIRLLHSEGLEAWVHYRRALLDQGRCIPMKLEKENGEEEGEEEEKKEEDDEDDEEKEEKVEEEPEIIEAILESEVPLLRSLSEDRALGRLQPWTRKLSSKLVSETAILILYSNLWPGAYTFYDGKCFEHIYIGQGYKYSVFHYAPPMRMAWQSEYPVGEDVIEHVDEEIQPETEEEKLETDDGEKEGEDEETEDNAEEEKEELEG